MAVMWRTEEQMTSQNHTEIVAIVAVDGLPPAVSVARASPAECRLVGAVLAGCFLDELLRI
jgi:hypothetical protein